MTKYLYSQGIRIFDYAQFAEPLRNEIRANAEAVAQANGLKIEYIRKEERIQEILGRRGSEPGLVHIFSAMEGMFFAPTLARQGDRTYIQRKWDRCIVPQVSLHSFHFRSVYMTPLKKGQWRRTRYKTEGGRD